MNDRFRLQYKFTYVDTGKKGHYRFTYDRILGRYKFKYDCFEEIYYENLYTYFMYPQHNLNIANSFNEFIYPSHEINNQCKTIEFMYPNLAIEFKSLLASFKRFIFEARYHNYPQNYNIKSKKFDLYKNILECKNPYKDTFKNLNNVSFNILYHSLLNTFNAFLGYTNTLELGMSTDNILKSKSYKHFILYKDLDLDFIYFPQLYLTLDYILSNAFIKDMYSIKMNIAEKGDNDINIIVQPLLYKSSDNLNLQNFCFLLSQFNEFRLFCKYVQDFLIECPIKDLNALYSIPLTQEIKRIQIQSFNLSSIEYKSLFTEKNLQLEHDLNLLNDLILNQTANLKLHEALNDLQYLEKKLQKRAEKDISNYQLVEFLNLLFKESYTENIYLNIIKDKKTIANDMFIERFMRWIKDEIGILYLIERFIKNDREVYNQCSVRFMEKLFKNIDRFNLIQKLNKSSKPFFNFYLESFYNKNFKDLRTIDLEKLSIRQKIRQTLKYKGFYFFNKYNIKDINKFNLDSYLEYFRFVPVLHSNTEMFTEYDNLYKAFEEIYNNSLESSNLKKLTTNDINIRKLDTNFKNLDISKILTFYKREFYNLDLLKDTLLIYELNSLNLEDEHELKLWKRFWFLYAGNIIDKKILPCCDFPYEDSPIIFEGFDDLMPENWQSIYPETFWLKIDHHPILEGKKIGRNEIPLAINVMVEIVNIFILMWFRFYNAFWGWTGTQAIIGITESVYEWLTLESSRNEQDNKLSRQHYDRCYRWLRWEAEKVALMARNDMELRGNYYVGILLEEMINYMLDHHFNTIPIFVDVNKMDEWRNLFNRNLQTDISWVLDKVKGIRHKLIVGREKKENV